MKKIIWTSNNKVKIKWFFTIILLLNNDENVFKKQIIKRIFIAVQIDEINRLFNKSNNSYSNEKMKFLIINYKKNF